MEVASIVRDFGRFAVILVESQSLQSKVQRIDKLRFAVLLALTCKLLLKKVSGSNCRYPCLALMVSVQTRLRSLSTDTFVVNQAIAKQPHQKHQAARMKQISCSTSLTRMTNNRPGISPVCVAAASTAAALGSTYRT